MKSLSKGLTSNPISKILDLVPYTETILDPLILDSMCMVMKECGYWYVCNSIVVILLIELREAGLISLEEHTYVSATGSIIIIRKM